MLTVLVSGLYRGPAHVVDINQIYRLPQHTSSAVLSRGGGLSCSVLPYPLHAAAVYMSKCLCARY